MRKEELFEALADLDPDSVKKAGAYKKRKMSVWKRGLAFAACLVIVVGLIAGLPEIKKKESQGGSSMGLKTVLAAYPEAVGKKLSAEAFMEGDEHYNWWQSYREKLDVSRELQKDLKTYNEAMMKELLPSDHDNTVCSPLNTYIALAMLAEITDGNSRKQVLDLLGAEDMDHLREGITALWESNYVDTPILKSLLANSIWMKEGMNYEEETLKRLAESYYVSSFRGTPGSSEMNEALRKWTDENTGGLLSEYTKDMTIKADTVLDLVSTIYYKAMWMGDGVAAKPGEEQPAAAPATNDGASVSMGGFGAAVADDEKIPFYGYLSRRGPYCHRS